MKGQTPGLDKLCGRNGPNGEKPRCAPRRQTTCRHSWYLAFKFRKGKHHRISLDKYAGKHLSKDEAKAVANDLRSAIRNGEYPPAAPAPAVTPLDVTFTKLGKLWMEREREDRIADWKSDRSRLAGLAKLTIEQDATLGDRLIGRIAADDLEVAFRQLKTERGGQTPARGFPRKWRARQGSNLRPRLRSRMLKER